MKHAQMKTCVDGSMSKFIQMEIPTCGNFRMFHSGMFSRFHCFLVSIVLSFPWFSCFHGFIVSHGFLVSIVFRFHWFSLQHIFKTNSIFVLHVYMAQSAQDAEIAVDAAQCCGTSTRAVNGQVRQCNSMCLLRCSCEHAEMRRYVVVRQQRTIVIRSRSTHGRSQRGGYRKMFFHKKMHITNLRPFF